MTVTHQHSDETGHDGGTESPDGERPARPSHGPQWRSFLRTGLLVAVLLGMLWAVISLDLPPVEELRARLEELGWGARFGFIGLYAVVAITPIPVTVIALTGGVLFGVVEGSILSVIGVLIGCWVAYWLARGLGRPTVERLLGRHAPTVGHHLSHDGFEAVYTLRLMPGLPYWPVNYGAGAFGVTQRDFAVASALAVVPGQISLVAVGAFIADRSVVNGIVVAAAWVVVGLMTIWAFRRWRGTSEQRLPGERLREG